MDRARIPVSIGAMHPINFSIAADNGLQTVSADICWAECDWSLWPRSFYEITVQIPKHELTRDLLGLIETTLQKHDRLQRWLANFGAWRIVSSVHRN